MRKKRATKSANMKKPSIKNSVIHNMEVTFKEMPAKIAERCHVEMSVLKKQEAKLTQGLKKAFVQGKVFEKKLTSFTKSNHKMTPAIKKQMVATKKSLDLVSKQVKDSTVQLEQINKQISRLSSTEKTFSLIGKELAKLEKSLMKKFTENTATRKKASKKAKKVRTSKSSQSSAPSHQEQFESVTETTESVEMA